MLEHVESPASFLGELRRVLLPGGNCYLTAINRHALRDPHFGDRRARAVELLATSLLVLATSSGRAGVVALPVHSSAIQVDAGGDVYLVNPDSDTAARLSPVAGGIQTKRWEHAVGAHPRTLAVVGGTVYTANQDDDSLSMLSGSDGSRAHADVPLGFGCAPFGIAASPAGDRLYVSCQGTRELVVLGSDLTPIARLGLDWPAPRGLAVSGDGRHVYVAHFLTVEPSNDAHVSEVDATTLALTPRRVLTVPADRRTCETVSSGQGTTNDLNVVALTPPGSPVANQLWVGGTLENNLAKGLFERYAGFRDRPEKALFDLPCPADDLSMSCRFESFPRGNGAAAVKRNLFTPSFHDITRAVVWKLDLESGAVMGKLDLDGASNATDLVFSADGTVAYVVDQMVHTLYVFNTRRGQDGNPATLFAPVAKLGPFGADPSRPCDGEPTASVTDEAPFILPPEVQITALHAGDPVKLEGASASVVSTGVDFDTRTYQTTLAARLADPAAPMPTARMRRVPDAIGTAPMGIALSPDGCVAYVANYLARNVVAVAAKGGDPACTGSGPTVDFRCAADVGRPCQSELDCAGGGFCGHPGGGSCTSDGDCPLGGGPCIASRSCVPLVVGDPVATTGSDPVPPEILDGKILFNTAARDASLPNGLGLSAPAPLFDGVQKGCEDDPAGSPCRTDADCSAGSRCVVASMPGEVVSTSHEASYVACTTCHVDFGGQDGRTWDFSQFGSSLRNTMDLRGRAQAAPGTCDAALAADAARGGAPCHFDAECGSGSLPNACHYDPTDDTKFPPHLSLADRARFLNPMMTVHWNGDRMEVEGFEFTYRSLLGAGDCDGRETDPTRCLGALLPRSLLVSTAAIPAGGGFESDLRSTLRNLEVSDLRGRRFDASVRLTHVADFVYSLTRFPRNPFLGERNEAPSEAAERGRRLFNDTKTQCAACHEGPSATTELFTDRRPNPDFVRAEPPGAATNNPFLRHAVSTENLFDLTDPFVVASANRTFQNETAPIPASRGPLLDYVTPVLTDVWNTAPYLHDGSAATLLDVIRFCNTRRTDCGQPGLGRNINDLHGRTSFLTPQQLNDLVAFQKAPHGPVAAGAESVVKAGQFALRTVLLKFGKRPGRGRFRIVGTATPGSLPVDPKTGGLSLTLAVPAGEAMVVHLTEAPAQKVKGGRHRFSYRTPRSDPPVTIHLTRLEFGDYRLVVNGRRADLSALDNGALDVTVALVTGQTQFVENRVLTARNDGRTLVLGNRRRW
ncbi:MAG: hypothetical protein E6J71_08400 [Deltaproteobacteria bacterium]|nr:MAG: hypothetical protein E6J71_08400 [Deltaproteobacteria bacterium]